MSDGEKKCGSTFDYFSYWQKRLYDNDKIEDCQERLFGEHQVPGKVLELGCGCGRLSPLFKDYLGVDLNPRAIEKAKATYADKKFKVADIVTDEIGQAENIVTCAFLQHIPDGLVEDVAKKIEAKNIMLFESVLEGYRAPWCFSHDYEELFGKAHYIESIPHTPARFMVFRRGE